MKNIDLVVSGWGDYELLDSGENRKLERFGSYTLIRPETQAIWHPQDRKAWNEADAEFQFVQGKGKWHLENDIPENWQVGFEDADAILRLTNFKHIGIFPEQAANWRWMGERLDNLTQPKVLNLFGYTGIASVIAAQHGAQVTHVDASKQSNLWAKENARVSGVPDAGIRYLLDDALKFAEREVRRGDVYEGIILDPPAFGRGAKGEVWKIEESLPKLLAVIERLLSRKPGSFFLLNGYAAGYSPLSFVQAVEGVFKREHGEYGELQIKEKRTDRVIPSGIYVRFSR